MTTGRYRAHYTIQSPQWQDEDGDVITMSNVAQVSAFNSAEYAAQWLAAAEAQGALTPVSVEDAVTGHVLYDADALRTLQARNGPADET